MNTVERPLGGAEIEVAAKATRRRFTLDYKRQIVHEADAFVSASACSSQYVMPITRDGVRRARGPGPALALRMAERPRVDRRAGAPRPDGRR